MNPFKTAVIGSLFALALPTVWAATPAEFVDEASAKGIAEIEAGKLALEKSQSADVKHFAQMMIDHHTAVNQKLKAIAEEQKLKVSTDAELMDKAKKMILEVRDDSFDRSYANNQVKSHESAVELFKHEAAEGHDKQLQAFAKEGLPKLEAHLDEAKKLAAAHQK